MRLLTAALLAALASGPGCRAPSPRDRAVDQLAAAMTERVRAGDADGYLALVDLADPHFATEQRAWAEAVRKGGLGSFDARRDGRAIRYTWRPSPDADERAVAYVPRLSGEPGGAPRYAGPDWPVIAGADGRIRVHAPPALAVEAELVRSAFARVAPVVEAFFGVEGAEPPPVKLFDDVAHLQLSIAPTYDPPLGGWYEPGESIKMLWRPGRSPGSIERVLAHEYGHALYFAMGIRNWETPWWAHEGVAEAAASAVQDGLPATNERLRALAAEGKLADFDDLAVFDDDTFMDQRLAYPMGHSMVRYVLDTHGREAGFEWLRTLGDLGTDGASHAALGLGFDELDAAWRASLQGPASDAEATPGS